MKKNSAIFKDDPLCIDLILLYRRRRATRSAIDDGFTCTHRSVHGFPGALRRAIRPKKLEQFTQCVVFLSGMCFSGFVCLHEFGHDCASDFRAGGWRSEFTALPLVIGDGIVGLLQC